MFLLDANSIDGDFGPYGDGEFSVGNGDGGGQGCGAFTLVGDGTLNVEYGGREGNGKGNSDNRLTRMQWGFGNTGQVDGGGWSDVSYMGDSRHAILMTGARYVSTTTE